MLEEACKERVPVRENRTGIAELRGLDNVEDWQELVESVNDFKHTYTRPARPSVNNTRNLNFYSIELLLE